MILEVSSKVFREAQLALDHLKNEQLAYLIRSLHWKLRKESYSR